MMNRMFKKITSCAAACAIAGSMLSALPAGAYDFNDLDQAEFVKAMGLGWNLGNTLEATNGNGVVSETAWGNPKASEEIIKMVKAQGFKSIRVPVSWLANIGDAPNYTIKSTWLKRVHEVVDYCVDNDMYVIVNMHGDGYHSVQGAWLFCDANETQQKTIRAKYESVWRQIANEFKDTDEHLIFESMNEEFDGTYNDPDKTAYENINKYNQIFVDTIRKTGGNNAKRWLLVAGWNTDINYTANDYGFKLPTDTNCTAESNRIAVSVHYYNPWDFCGNESNFLKTQWGPEAKQSRAPSYGGPADLESNFKLLYDKFTSQGYPCIIGEFGNIDRSLYDRNNAEFRRYWCQAVVAASKKYGCVPVYWDNGWNGANGHAVFDRVNLKVTQQDIIDGMVKTINTEDVSNYTPDPINFKVLSLGDVDKSGKINVNDVLRVIQMVNGRIVINNVKNAEANILADVNEDKSIDVKDAMILIQVVKGKYKKTLPTNDSVYGTGKMS